MQNLIKMLEITLDSNPRLETLDSHISPTLRAQKVHQATPTRVCYCSILTQNVQGFLRFLFSAFVTTATRMIRTVIRVHLVSVIVSVRSVCRVVGIHLIRIVIELTARMRIPGNTMSFCHVDTPHII